MYDKNNTHAFSGGTNCTIRKKTPAAFLLEKPAFKEVWIPKGKTDPGLQFGISAK